jgi:hypothetical protein
LDTELSDKIEELLEMVWYDDKGFKTVGMVSDVRRNVKYPNLHIPNHIFK